MLREIITPKAQEYILKIPAEYLNTQVEILVLPLNEQERKPFKKYSKQEMLKHLNYQGTTIDNKNIDELIY